MVAAGDAAYADREKAKSTHGHLIYLNGGPVAWKTGVQKTVAASTTEAELTSMMLTAKETIGLSRLLLQLGKNEIKEIPVLCDNKQTVDIINKVNPAPVTAMRHVNVRQHWLRELDHDNTTPIPLRFLWVPTGKMPADGMTKRLGVTQFKAFITQLGMVDVEK